MNAIASCALRPTLGVASGQIDDDQVGLSDLGAHVFHDWPRDRELVGARALDVVRGFDDLLVNLPLIVQASPVG